MANGGTTAEDKRKHLKLIQGVVNRMASNSFLFKVWSMWRRVYYKVTQPELIDLLDIVKTNTSRSYTLSSAKEKFGDDFVNKAQSDGFIDIKNESIGISVGDWSPTHEVLKLTSRSKTLARTHQENERSTELRSDAKRNIAIRVIGGLITAALLYTIGRMLSISL